MYFVILIIYVLCLCLFSLFWIKWIIIKNSPWKQHKNYLISRRTYYGDINDTREEELNLIPNYAPDISKRKEEKETFYGNLQTLLDTTATDSFTIFFGDLYARVIELTKICRDNKPYSRRLQEGLPNIWRERNRIKAEKHKQSLSVESEDDFFISIISSKLKKKIFILFYPFWLFFFVFFLIYPNIPDYIFNAKLNSNFNAPSDTCTLFQHINFKVPVQLRLIQIPISPGLMTYYHPLSHVMYNFGSFCLPELTTLNYYNIFLKVIEKRKCPDKNISTIYLSETLSPST